MSNYSVTTGTSYFFSLFRTLIVCLCLSYPLQSSLCFGAELFILEHPRTIVTLTGFTRPRTELTISSEVSGRCLFVSGDIGDLIDESSSFIRIDPTFILLDIDGNKLAREQLKRKININKQELNRYTKLHTNQSAPQAKLDQVSLEHELSVIKLKQLINTGERLQELLKRHVIKPPAGYRIIDRTVEPGELINSGQHLAKLGDFRELLVPLVLTYDEYKVLQTTSTIPVFLPDLDLMLQAKLFRTAPDFDKKSRKIKVELILTKQQTDKLSSLRGGLRVFVQVSILDKTGSYIVPASAIQERHNYFWLTKSDGTRKKVVFLGKAKGDDQMLVSGNDLVPGEQFLTQPDN